MTNPPGISDELLELYAKSLYLHGSGATGGTSHWTDFGHKNISLDEWTDIVKQIAHDPNTHFMINRSTDPTRSGTVILFNDDLKTFLIANPNNLQDPLIENGKFITGAKGPDNFAGTVYRDPKLNTDGTPLSSSGARTLKKDSEINKLYKGAIKNIKKNIAIAMGVPVNDVPIKTISQSAEWAEELAKHEDALRSGLEKGVKNILDGKWTHAVEETAEKIAHTNSAKGLSHVDDVGARVKTISKLAKSGRLGANITGIGIVIGGASLLMTREAHAIQREYANGLQQYGILSEDAKDSYIQINTDMEEILYGDLAISTADPTGLSVALTIGVEAKARNDFRDWADKYAPDLTEEHFQRLSMSMLPGNSARADMIWNARSELPGHTHRQSTDLHTAITLNALYNEAQEICYSHKEGYVYRGNLSETMTKAKALGIEPEGGFNFFNISKTIQDLEKAIKQTLITEMDKILSDPKHTDMMLNATPIDDRLDYARRLAKSEPDPTGFVRNHPEMAAYMKEYEDSWTGTTWETKKDDIFLRKPELLNAYIKDRTLGSFGEKMKPHITPYATPPGEKLNQKITPAQFGIQGVNDPDNCATEQAPCSAPAYISPRKP